MAIWLVRAGGHGEEQNWALENNKVVNGWDDVVDLSKFKTRMDLLKYLGELYLDAKPAKLRNHCAQLWAFSKRISKDDLVALPLKGRSAIAIGRVIGEYKYFPANPPGTKHTLPVEWITKDMPRNRFDQDLLYSFGAFMTICQITRNNAEQRIRALLEGKAAPVVVSTTEGIDEVTDEAPETLVNLTEYAADQISQWLSTKFTGHRLADLINAVLEAQGYKTLVSPAGPDGGVDILAGSGPLGFDPPRIVVQVKSGDSQQDVKVLRELKGVMHDFNAQQGLFVAWGGFKHNVYMEARKNFFEVRLWDARDIVENVLLYYDKFDEEIKAELPLKRIWILVQEGEE